MTQSDWFTRISAWVPEELLNQSVHVAPILQGMAATMAAYEVERAALIAETYITTADGVWLGSHGHERNTLRITNETDALYGPRVQGNHLINKFDVITIKSIVDGLLLSGTSLIEEDWANGNTYGNYFNRLAFMNRGLITNPTMIKDAFAIVIPRQYHQPYSFFSRGYFCNRLNFEGTTGSNLVLLQAIIQAVNDSRVFGATFRLIERYN